MHTLSSFINSINGNIPEYHPAYKNLNTSNYL